MSLTKKIRVSKSKHKKSITKTKTCKTKGLNIYKITNIFHKNRTCWDCAYGFVIIAKNELSARKLIDPSNNFTDYNEECKWIGKHKNEKNKIEDFWLNSNYSKCEIIGKSCLKNEGIVLVDFQDG
jgi:hypothetical protein